MSQSETVTLYQRIGGAPTVDRLVADFYNRVLSDSELSPFFVDVDTEALRRMQREFFGAALDGPIRYDGMALSHAHSARGIDRRHVARFVEHLLASLQGCGIDDEDVRRIIARINTYVDDVVGGTGPSG